MWVVWCGHPWDNCRGKTPHVMLAETPTRQTSRVSLKDINLVSYRTVIIYVDI